MPHYRDGTPARFGDLVRGKGYNLRGKDGSLAEISGKVIRVVPSSEVCNIQVACLIEAEMPADFAPPDHRLFAEKGLLWRIDEGGPPRWVMLQPHVEYGQCDHFEKIG